MSESRVEISKRSREAILSALKNGFKGANANLSPSADPAVHIKSSDDMLAEMKQKMSDNKFIVEESDEGHLEAKINEIVASYGYEKLIYPSNLQLDLGKINASEKVCFDKSVETLRKEVFHSEFSIINARCGVSSHGVVCVLSSKEQPRMLSLAPTLCIILLKKEAIVKSMSEALNLVKAERLGALPDAGGSSNSNGGIFKDGKVAAKSVSSSALNTAQSVASKSGAGVLPSNVLFIAGPSRTADIELITVFGVHGSQKVHLILY